MINQKSVRLRAESDQSFVGMVMTGPVNQQIVVGQPAMTKNCEDRIVQLGDIECNQHFRTGWKSNGNGCGRCDGSVGSTVEKAERNRQNEIGQKVMLRDYGGIYETM